MSASLDRESLLRRFWHGTDYLTKDKPIDVHTQHRRQIVESRRRRRVILLQDVRRDHEPDA